MHGHKRLSADAVAGIALLFRLLLVAGVLNSVSLLRQVTADNGDVTAEPNSTSDANELQKSPEPSQNRPSHAHPAFKQRRDERRAMVAAQIQERGVSDPNVLAAMLTIPRHAFVPARYQALAYADQPLPIGHEQTISQPYIVAYMTEALHLDANSVVLEVGTGSGYQAAVCAEIARRVYSIEIVEPLAESAKKLLTELGYVNVTVKAGDGYVGWLQHAPFDAVIITAAAGEIPKPLIDQLKKGGRLIMPVGRPQGYQELILLTKDTEGKVQRKRLLPVRFVPMTGEAQQKD